MRESNPEDNFIVSAIAAVDRQGAIGKNGTIPWYEPKDLEWFREKTMDCPLILGRKTMDSIVDYHDYDDHQANQENLLPGRVKIVLTREPDKHYPYLLTASCLLDAFHLASNAIDDYDLDREVFIGGGEMIYNLAANTVQRLYLSRLDLIVKEPDAYFPFREYNQFDWYQRAFDIKQNNYLMEQYIFIRDNKKDDPKDLKPVEQIDHTLKSDLQANEPT